MNRNHLIVSLTAAVALWSIVMPCHSQPRAALVQKMKLVSNKLEFAKELQATLGSPATQDILSAAESQLNRARELLSAGRPLLANQRLNDAEQSVNHAMRTLLKEPMRLRRENLEQKIQIVADLLRQTPHPRAQQWLDTGIEQKKLAEQAFQSGDFQQAIRLFRKAEFNVQKAFDSATGKDVATEAQAEAEARGLEQLLEQSRSSLASSSEAQVQRNYRQILKLIGRAQQARARGDFRTAIDLYHQATRLLHRTRDLAAGKTDRTADRAFEELAALDDLIETLRQRVALYQDDERIEFFMSHLEQVHQAAHRAMEQQNYQRVLLNTELARDLIERIQNKLRSNSGNDSELILSELERLERELNAIQQRIRIRGEHDQAKILLSYAQSAKATVEELAQKQNVQLARYSLVIANRLIEACDQLISTPTVEPPSADTLRSKMLTIATEMASLQSKSMAGTSETARYYFETARKFLELARENLEKDYRYVSHHCLELSMMALNQLKESL